MVKKIQQYVLAYLFILTFLLSSVNAYQKLDAQQYALLNDTLNTHLNYFLSSEVVTSYGMIPTAYKEGDRARFGYSNPTEWGYLLQAYIVAADRGKITNAAAIIAINQTLTTLDKIQSNSTEVYNGLYYPIYKVTKPDTPNKGTDIFPYAEKTNDDYHQGIPSIDNGLLYMSLLIVDGWARDHNYAEISNKSQKIYNKMNFSDFVFSENGGLYMTHVIYANTGIKGTSKWNIYADEGGMMSIIEYLSGGITLTDFQNITNNQLREARSWGGQTAAESAYFNSMFTWSVRSIAGINVTGTRYSIQSLIPSFKAHLVYGDLFNVSYPAFSDAMSQGLVQYYIPMNYANQVPTPQNHVTPHALFVPLNVLADLDQSTINRIIQEIKELKADSQVYYYDNGTYPFGFLVTASRYANISSYSGVQPADGKYIFETLSEGYTSLSIFNALEYEDKGKDFSYYLAKVPGTQIKVNTLLSTLYSPNCTDADHDGYSPDGGNCGLIDCNDANPAINPGMAEICNDGIDNNCNGAIDGVDQACRLDCTIPTDGMTISQNTNLCSGTYNLPNGLTTPWSSSNIVLNCNGALIQGNRTSGSNGLYLSNGAGWIVENCNFKGYESCLQSWNGDGDLFTNDSARDCNTGFYLRDAPRQNVTNSMAINNTYGIQYYWNAQNGLIQNNYIENNSAYGILLSNNADFTIIKNNFIKNNWAGIRIATNNVNITENNFIQNNYGLSTAGTSNLAYKNNFIKNTLGLDPINYGFGPISLNFSNLGNYWSNYDTPSKGCNDLNSDGVCDSPYFLGTNNTDYFPYTRQYGWLPIFPKIFLNKGWNLFAPSFGFEDTNTNRTIALNKGWNLFGYSSNKTLNWTDAYLINGTQNIKILNASNLIQITIYTYVNGTYTFIPTQDTYLRQNKAYWIYALADNLTLVLPNVGGSLATNQFNWLTANIINATQTNTVSSAADANQIQLIMFGNENSKYTLIPEDNVNVNPWKGYWLYSFSDNLSLSWGNN